MDDDHLFLKKENNKFIIEKNKKHFPIYSIFTGLSAGRPKKIKKIEN